MRLRTWCCWPRTSSPEDQRDPSHDPSCRSQTAETWRWIMSETLRESHAVLGRSQSNAAHGPRPMAQWLILAYLAADNDLEGELLADLAEMERVGSTPGVVEILA